jgi:hypothetical protein
MPFSWSKPWKSLKAFCHSASVASVIWIPGSWRQKRSGQSAT